MVMVMVIECDYINYLINFTNVSRSYLKFLNVFSSCVCISIALYSANNLSIGLTEFYWKV